MDEQPNVTVSELVQGEVKQVTWELKNWKKNHDLLVATSAGCLLQTGDPKVIIRFFLRPLLNKSCQEAAAEAGKGFKVTKCYSLFAEVKQSPPNFAYKVTAQTNLGVNSTDGVTFTPTKSQNKAMEVIQDLIHLKEQCSQYTQLVQYATGGYGYGYVCPYSSIQDLVVTINVSLYNLNESSTGPEIAVGQQNSPAENSDECGEVSLFAQLKAMYAAENNYSDLKLESKDNMVLPAHKFQLAARSPYFRKIIDDAIEKGTFDGTLKISEVNGKPLMLILYWIYTGELNEKVGKFMEEIVNAVIKFELNGLMKILDKKLITICKKENMFKLYKVAEKNGLPTAMKDIRAYIRQNV